MVVIMTTIINKQGKYDHVAVDDDHLIWLY